MMTDTMLNGFFCRERLCWTYFAECRYAECCSAFHLPEWRSQSVFFSQPQPNDAINDLCWQAWRYDTRQNNTWHNDTQHNVLNRDTHEYSIKWQYAECRNSEFCTVLLAVIMLSARLIACISHQCSKTTDLSCHRCLINTGVENNVQHLNIGYNFDHQMFLSKSKCGYSNNCLHFLNIAVPLKGWFYSE